MKSERLRGMLVFCILLVWTFTNVSEYARGQTLSSPNFTPAGQQEGAPASNQEKNPRLTRREAKEEDQATGPDEEVVRVESNLTNLFFNALDQDKRFITTLRQEDLRVLEDGVPQAIFSFGRQTDLGLSLAILIDTSMSQERTLPDEKRAARDFVISVLRPERDQAAIVSFTGEATLEQEMTKDKARLQIAISRTEIATPEGYLGGGTVVPGLGSPADPSQNIIGSTAVWDAVWVTSQEVMKTAPPRTRRAIILLSDGDDTSSRLKSDEAISQAIKSETVIYAIGIGDNKYNGIDKKKLRKVAEKTGGRAFFPRNENELPLAFSQIEQELRTQYLIAYSPLNKTRDGSYRQVKIEITNPDLRKQNVRLTYRDGYFAKSGPPAQRARAHEQ